MKERILVIGKDLNYNLEYFITKAFERANKEVRFLGYADLLGNRYHELIRMLWSRSNLVRKISIPIWLKKLNDFYLNEAMKFNPDIILSIKGETFLPKYIDTVKAKTNAKIALWFPDDPRFFNSLTSKVALNYDTIFTYSKNAINLYKDISVNSVFRLPFGCDPEIHKGNLDLKSIKDRVLFIGTFSHKRYLFLKRLIKSGVSVDIIGSKWGSFLSKYVIGGSVFGYQYVKKLQSYTAVINLHQSTNYGPNMRTFEVTGSGGSLITDRAEDINVFFSEGKEIQIFDSIEDIVKKIGYLQNDKEFLVKMTMMAQAKCYKHHTYDLRAQEILNYLR
ncbi:CgeB family protein [Caldiplasma sukawensis]